MDVTPDLEDEMKEDAIVIAYLKDFEVAVEFYGALTNMQWFKLGMDREEQTYKVLSGMPVAWSASWRHVGGIIAYIRNVHYNTQEDYMHFYCSNNEGEVTERVRECFNRMGWVPRPWPDRDNHV